MPDFIMAHDLGTTGDKATLFDSFGHVIATAFAPYPTNYPEPLHVEQDPESWWNAVCGTTRRLMDMHPAAQTSLAAVSFSAMMNGCLLLDGNAAILRPAMIHADTRSIAQCERIASEFGMERAYEVTGNRIAPYFTLGKLAWLAECEPDVVAHARYCVQAKDFIAGRLTGVWGYTDHSDASLIGCYDLTKLEYCEELIDAAGFSKSLLPAPLKSSTVVGTVTFEAARQTGLPAGTRVVIGAGDGACATAGAGAVNVGDAYHYLGGTSWVAALTQGYRPDPTQRVSSFCSVEPEQCVLYGTVQSAGTSVDWITSILFDLDTSGFKDLEEIASIAKPGSDGLIYLPYLAGERSPIWDARAKGVLFGLTAAHGRAEIARCVLEGVSYALSSNLKVLTEMGEAGGTLRGLGGGMRSKLWRSILASVYNRPIALMERLLEATSCGAAMAAAVGVGICGDYEAAAKLFTPAGETVEPDPAAVEVYSVAQERFAALYPALASQFTG